MRRLLLLSCALVTLGACNERIDNTVGCPILCPRGAVDIQTETIEAVILDTTVSALLAPGAEELMLLANRGDTLDTRIIMRFDSISPVYIPDPTNDLTEVPITEIYDADP